MIETLARKDNDPKKLYIFSQPACTLINMYEDYTWEMEHRETLCDNVTTKKLNGVFHTYKASEANHTITS